jgi:hypothetical protein
VGVEALRAGAVRRQDIAIGLRCVFRQPREQRGTEVEVDTGVVVDYFDDAILCVQNARSAVGRVALGGDAFIPIVVGISGILLFDSFQPCVLARRLIKMTVNA